jgi:hypothetical protein
VAHTVVRRLAVSLPLVGSGVLRELRHLLNKSIHQCLVNAEGRKVDINELTHQSCTCVVWQRRHLLGESIQQGLAKAVGRKVDINELTISQESMCWGSSSLSSPSPFNRV